MIPLDPDGKVGLCRVCRENIADAIDRHRAAAAHPELFEDTP